MFARALVLVRANAHEAGPGDLDLLAAAAGLAREVVGVCLGPEEAAGHLSGRCDICLAGSGLAERPDAVSLAEALRPYITKNDLALVRHDSLGMDVGPGLATLLRLPFVTNITALEMDGATETLRVRRPEFNGQVEAEYAVTTGRGALFTVMPGALAPKDVPVKETRLAHVAAGSGVRRVFLGETQPRTAGVNLKAASVLVGTGRGMGSAENIGAAFRLAALLGGEVCCSRAVADAGWLDKDRQVGLSGETVSPAVYLTLGLHGAFQHLAGVAGSPCIIAVNTNKDAPIFNAAEIGVVADAASFAEQLADALERG